MEKVVTVIDLHKFTAVIPIVTGGGPRKTGLSWSWDLGPKVILRVAKAHGLENMIVNMQLGNDSSVELALSTNVEMSKVADFSASLNAEITIALNDAYSADRLPSITPPIVTALESDDPEKAIMDLWRGSADSMPNTPPRTLHRQYEVDGIPGTQPITVTSVPHCVKYNGQFWTLHLPDRTSLRYMDQTYVISDEPDHGAIDLGNDNDPSSMPNTPPRT